MATDLEIRLKVEFQKLYIKYVAYTCRAYLDEKVEVRIKGNVKRRGPLDWKSGENLWLIDVIVPFGGTDKVVQQLKQEVFKGQKVKSLQPAPGGGLAVVEW